MILTATTATTATDSAGEPVFLDVFVCLTEISGAVIENYVLSVHPAAQGGLAVATLALVLPQIEVLLASERVRQQVQQILGTALAKASS